MIPCKICGKEFKTEKAFHGHLKGHGMYCAEYYCTYYPRYSLFYKRQIPYFGKKDYFAREFVDLDEFLLWQEEADTDIVKTKSTEMLLGRIRGKKYKYAPCHNEIKTLDLPPIDVFKKHFGSYNKACKSIDCEPLFNKPIPKEFHKLDLSEARIIADTREQTPLPFKNMRKEKLFVGDYLIDGGECNGTYVDRKSESDFLVTFGSGLKRFERELQRAIDLDGYIFVVIESSIKNLKNNQKRFKRKSNLEYMLHNVRHLPHKYPRRIQFVFTGSREKSVEIIPKLLHTGKSLWNVDIQYYLDKGII